MSVNGKNRRRSYVRRTLCAALLGVMACLSLPPHPAIGRYRDPPDRTLEREMDRWMRRETKKAKRKYHTVENVSRALQCCENGRELFLQKKYVEAEHLFQEALRLFPEWIPTHSYLGQIFFEYHQDYVRAIHHLEIAAQHPYYRQIALYYLAQAYAGAGETRRAWETWQEYFEICTPGTEWETKAREYAAAVKVSLETETPPPEAAGPPSPSPSPAPLSR